MIGTTLSHYEVLEKIGAGGMGEVYRARDGKLGRDVAIKVLPEVFAHAPERLARFQREAQLLASLNHPNIAAIHGLEESEGVHYLVLELVPGETLADRLRSGALSVEEVVQLAIQIARALDAAHEKGVIHRDLKPANVKITPDGEIKVLDFGLAKAFHEETSSPELSNSPTFSAASTRAGVILGTVAYMSPEQARGKAVDKRSDIFSFGVVLFEMLTGRQLFEGEEVTDLLASVLKTEPDWKRLPPGVPPRLHQLLKRCLAKDPKRRFRDMGDIELELEDAFARPTAEAPSAAPPARSMWPVVAVVALVSGLLAGTAVWIARPTPPRQVTRFSVALPEGQAFSYTGRRVVAVSPSGSHIAYVAQGKLNLRALDSMESMPLAGTEGSRTPFFSPDGNWIGFWAPNTLKKVALTGGTPIDLCPAENPYGASWTPDGTILVGQGARGIFRVSENGGEPETLVGIEKSELAYGPLMLPDGKTLLFTLASGSDWDGAQVVAQNLETSERKVLIRGGADARYVPTGHLVYALRGTLLAVPFDPGTVEVLGGPVPVVEGVMRSLANTGAAHFSFSSNGTLAFLPGDAGSSGFALSLLDRAGNRNALTDRQGIFSVPRLSPDGKKLAVRQREGNDIWILDRERDAFSRLTTEGRNDNPVWSPDSQWVAFASDRGTGTSFDLYRKRADFSGPAELLLEKEGDQGPEDWSRDGEWLVYQESFASGNSDIWALPLDAVEGSKEPRAIVKTTFDEYSASLSPDGRFLAYRSNESGRYEVYVQPFPGPGRRWTISTEGGNDPRWSRDGREIFYRSGSRLLVVAVETKPEFAPTTPRVLFEANMIIGPDRNFDVTPDGESFVAVQEPSAEGAGRSQLMVVLNWFDELERLVPRK